LDFHGLGIPAGLSIAKDDGDATGWAGIMRTKLLNSLANVKLVFIAVKEEFHWYGKPVQSCH
jgi:hypothetical protein